MSQQIWTFSFLKILCKKTFWKLSFFCQSKNAGKKAWSKNLYDKKIQKNWELHEKFYAQLKPSQNNFHKRDTQLCPIEFFFNLIWGFDPSHVRILTVRILHTERMFKIFNPFWTFFVFFINVSHLIWNWNFECDFQAMTCTEFSWGQFLWIYVNQIYV